MHLKRFALIFFVLVLLVSCRTTTSSAPPTETPGPSTPTPNIGSIDIPKTDPTMLATPKGGIPTTGGFDIPPEIAGHEKEWPLANHDYANTRAAVGSTINAGNVANLQVAWEAPLEGTAEWGAGTGNPVISDGVVYYEDLAANVYAVDFKTGDVIWNTRYNNKLFGPSGPAIGYGRVYALSRIDRYVALDIKTGQEQWQFDTGYQLASGAFQPAAFNNHVFFAMQAAVSGRGKVVYHSYQGGTSGAVYLMDPKTGKPQWFWQVVEKGFWGHPEVNSGGGLWFPPAIDTETGVSFWSSGNPSPVPGIKGWPNGSSRPGPNLYTNSMIALSFDGKLLWYNQVKPHDLFNLDFQISPILAKIPINGQDTDIVIGSGKLGVVYGFDEKTGKTLWKTSVGFHQNDELQELPVDPESTTWVAPGAWGGVEAPMAYADGTVYALTANLPSPYNATAYEADTPEQALNRSEGGSSLKDATAQLYAIDAATGNVLWTHDFDKVGFSGVTVVNDLLFTSTLDGEVYALSRADGSEVWQWQAPGGTNSWPAVSGDTIVWAFGLGDDPSVIALRLNASTPTSTPAQQRTPVLTPEGN
jgi:outer membrane protein assembly factor BamB